MPTSHNGEGCRRPVRGRFGKFNWHLLDRVLPKARVERAGYSWAELCRRPGRGLVWHSAVRAMSLPVGSTALLRVLSADEPSHPLTPWAVVDGCVSLFIPETGAERVGECTLALLGMGAAPTRCDRPRLSQCPFYSPHTRHGHSTRHRHTAT